jgi:hypothetical protein
MGRRRFDVRGSEGERRKGLREDEDELWRSEFGTVLRASSQDLLQLLEGTNFSSSLLSKPCWCGTDGGGSELMYSWLKKENIKRSNFTD